MRKTILAFIGTAVLTLGIIFGASAAKATNGEMYLTYAPHWGVTSPLNPLAGDTVFLYYEYGNPNQIWNLLGPNSNGTYNIQSNNNTSLCLSDQTGGSTGYPYILLACNRSNADQQWFWGTAPGGGFQVENANTANCIADDGYKLVDNNRIITWGCEYPVPQWENW